MQQSPRLRKCFQLLEKSRRDLKMPHPRVTGSAGGNGSRSIRTQLRRRSHVPSSVDASHSKKAPRALMRSPNIVRRAESSLCLSQIPPAVLLLATAAGQASSLISEGVHARARSLFHVCIKGGACLVSDVPEACVLLYTLERKSKCSAIEYYGLHSCCGECWGAVAWLTLKILRLF